MTPIWRLQERRDGPLVTAAIHDGHAVRDDVREHLKLSDAERLREEDPFTRKWTSFGDARMIGLYSRFQVDLNRDRTGAVYLKPEDAWGLEVWKEGPLPGLIDRSLAEYEAFYSEIEGLLTRLVRKHGRFLVYDLHSYNHRRGGPEHPPEDPEHNPEVNLGTASLDRNRWSPVIDGFIHALRGVDFLGRRLDVRENVKFTGGHFSQWIHSRFPERGCALAIDVKKFFMDEWTGTPYWDVICAIRGALEQTVRPALAGLDQAA